MFRNASPATLRGCTTNQPREITISSPEEKKSRTRVVAEVARGQHGCVTTRQLLEAGFSAPEIARMVAAGRLHRAYQGVYFVGHVPPAREAIWHAAVLGVGTDAGLSGLTAAANYGAWNGAVGIHVTAPRRLARRAGIDLHFAPAPIDLRLHRGIPCVSPERVALDLAMQVRSAAAYRRAIKQLQVKRLTSHADLVDFAAAAVGSRGVRRLRAALDMSHPRSRSENEDRMLRFLARNGFPLPEVNALVLGQEADLYWEDAGVIAEVDSWYHDTPTARRDDLRRDALWEAAGLRVVHLYDDAPDRVAETMLRLRSAL